VTARHPDPLPPGPRRPDPGPPIRAEGIAAAPGVSVHLCDLDPEGPEAAGTDAGDRALLSEAEAARAARFRFARDRDRYVRARAFLRRRLAGATGRAPGALVLTEGPWGKPALACGTVEFNLSHSGGLAALAISAAGPVGIDVEAVDPAVDVAGLSESCFTAAERAVLDGLDEAGRRRRFFVFWTAKEAVMKLTGQGLSLPPRDIELRLEGGWPAGVLRPRDPGLVLRRFDPGRGGVAACLALRVPQGQGEGIGPGDDGA
jgi:4'-phosphopantetheinyl transferase